MPKKARVHFVSLHSSLVNLPISIYGPLVERGVVSYPVNGSCWKLKWLISVHNI